MSDSALFPKLRERLEGAKVWEPTLIGLLQKLWGYGIDRIHEPGLKSLVSDFLEEQVPIPFFLEPTSHSGKYHPAWHNYRHGTVIHIVESCVLVQVAAQAIPGLLDSDRNLVNLAVDVALAATLISDTFKVDLQGRPTKADHGREAALAWREFALGRRRTYPEIVERVAQASIWHYGAFSPGLTDGQVFTPEQLLVQVTDVVSSAKLMEEIYVSAVKR